MKNRKKKPRITLTIEEVSNPPEIVVQKVPGKDETRVIIQGTRYLKQYSEYKGGDSTTLIEFEYE